MGLPEIRPRILVRETGLPVPGRVDQTLRWTFDERDSVLEVVMGGEIDLSSVKALQRDVENNVLAQQPSIVIFDLDAVTFVDSTGLRFLLDAKSKLDAWGSHLFLARPSDPVCKLLNISGVRALFSYLNEGCADGCYCPVCQHPLPGRTGTCPHCGSAC
jgi:anti-anti-sigma factor